MRRAMGGAYGRQAFGLPGEAFYEGVIGAGGAAPCAARWIARAFVCVLLVLVCLAPHLGGARAQVPLRFELDAPDSVRPLLLRYMRVFTRTDLTLPDTLADRSALARRTRREAEDLLATEGYFSPQVRVRRSPDGRWRLIVDPGRQATIEQVVIGFIGDLGADDPERTARREGLRRAWTLPVGQPFRQAAWDGAKQNLLDGVAFRDYAAARIEASRAEVDPERAVVRLSVTVDSGPPFFLGPLEVSGLKRLPPDLVHRYSTLKEGDRFDQERLLALQTVLQNAPQFASVIVDIERDPALAHAVPVRVEVSEAQFRHLGFGVGFSTNNGYRSEVSWRDVNLLGRAWELSSGLRIEQRRQSAYADVFLPPTLGARHRNSFGTAIERSEIQGLTVTSQAIGAARDRTRGNIDTRIGLRLLQETRRVEGGDTTRSKALTASWSWTRREVDNLLDPREGDVLQFEIGGGAKTLLSDQDFTRLYTRYVRYVPIAERDVLILRGEGGVTLAQSRDGIPQDFLFRAGGSQSVRGYAYQSLGVREGEAIVGGRYLATLSTEYVHWFRPDWGVAGFVDAGDAADSRNTFDLRVGYGLGARWRSPAGPLALDLAYGEADRRFRVHFAIAIAF